MELFFSEAPPKVEGKKKRPIVFFSAGFGKKMEGEYVGFFTPGSGFLGGPVASPPQPSARSTIEDILVPGELQQKSHEWRGRSLAGSWKVPFGEREREREREEDKKKPLPTR